MPGHRRPLRPKPCRSWAAPRAANDPGKTAVVFGRLIARAMPILLELGARAARGDLPSQILAARVLRTLAEAAGRPLSDDPVPAGLEVIETAFATVLPVGRRARCTEQQTACERPATRGPH